MRPGHERRLITEEARAGRRSVRNLVDLDVVRERGKGSRRERTTKETLWVLMEGRAEVLCGGESYAADRRSIFAAAPTVVHAGPGEEITFEADAGTEWIRVAASDSQFRGVRVYTPASIATEDRGAGLAQDACRRTVRTFFDYNTSPKSQLVVGEVINRAGRWSSYPPHHHAQPEIYHYRFTHPAGYGHAELGEEVVKVRDRDTTLIPGGLDHAQVAAPGYGMYYLWIVRHLPRRPYKGFTFTPAHKWLLDPQQQGWMPAE